MMNERTIACSYFELVPPKRYRVKTLVELLEVGEAVSAPHRMCRIRPRGDDNSVPFILSTMGRHCGEPLPEGFRPGDWYEGAAYIEWMVTEVEE